LHVKRKKKKRYSGQFYSSSFAGKRTILLLKGRAFKRIVIGKLRMGPPRFELGCQAPEAWRMGQATLRPLTYATKNGNINVCFSCADDTPPIIATTTSTPQ